LSIAGFDPSGGAGLLADIKTFAAFGVYGLAAISAIAAQNAFRFELFKLPPRALRSQIAMLSEAHEIAAIKIGMMGSGDAVRELVRLLHDMPQLLKLPILLDPVLRAGNGGRGLDEAGLEAMRQELIPLCDMLKPNLAEAAMLLEASQAATIEEMERQARALRDMGSCHVLLTGGHLGGAEAVDILCAPSGSCRRFSSPRRQGAENIHGTGCTLGAAIIANIALGHEMGEAVARARQYMNELFDQEAVRDRRANPVSLAHLSICRTAEPSDKG
jgi:hydroxymethylpyrimidine/phosphomethylpyrimidine kinase